MNRYIRQKRVPLPAWEDKIAAAMSLDSRDDGTVCHEGMQIRIIIWHCQINMFGSPLPKDYVALNVTSGICRGRHLMETPYGDICPHCRTNEYIVGQNSQLMPGELRKKKSENKMCLRCGTTTNQEAHNG
jgi:hypothetical protein